MRTRSALLALLLGVGLTSAQAAWVSFEQVNGDFTINYKGSDTDLSISGTPATSLLDLKVWYYTPNLTPQDSDSIRAELKAVYGLTTAPTFVSGCSKPAECVNGATVTPDLGVTSTQPYTSTFTSQGAFDYLAVHLGQAELFFHWLSPVTSITFAGLDSKSISNYQAFTLATPLPGAIWLFGSALLGFLGFSRKRSR